MRGSWVRLLVAAAICVGVGCSAGADEGAASRPILTRPSVRVATSFSTSEVALLPEIDLARAFTVATGAGRILVGSNAGLFALSGATGSEGTLERVDARPVHALAYVEALGFVWVSDDGIFVGDGAAFRPSTLEDSVKPDAIRSLVSRGPDLLVVTDDAVLVLSEGTLTTIRGLGRVTEVVARPSGAIVARREGGAALLELVDGSWLVRDIADLAWVVPVDGRRLFGVHDDARSLVERVSEDDARSSLRGVALAAEPDAPRASAIDALYTEPASGGLWVVQGDALSLLRGAVVTGGARPPGLPRDARAWATADGSLFFADSGRLVRVQAGPPVLSFSDAVRPIQVRHCERCHRAGGVAQFPLATAADWRSGADAILSAIESGRMPRDRSTTVSAAEIDVVRQWRAGGALD